MSQRLWHWDTNLVIPYVEHPKNKSIFKICVDYDILLPKEMEHMFQTKLEGEMAASHDDLEQFK